MFTMIQDGIIAAATRLWGYPMIFFLSLVGILFTFLLKGLQFSRFFTSGRLAYRYRTASGEGNITPLESLFSALGGLIGNGNIAGIATAIAIGGPGAIFWLWTASFIAMIIVYSETLLALKFREKSVDGTYSGGPMYYIEKVLKLKWLAVLFAFAMGFKTLIATSTIQSNSIAIAAKQIFPLDKLPQWMPELLPVCIILSMLTWIVINGGLKSIARALKKITPLMVIIYAIAGLTIIFVNIGSFLEMMKLIVTNAFTPAGAAGGFAGTTVLLSIRYGVARGFYSNEAGTGSSPIMYSTAQFDNPVKQSLIGMFGVFIDTVVGTLTAFAILITGVWISGETSTALASQAFNTFFGHYGSYVVFFSSFLFGYSTLIAWCFYGEQCFVYIWGPIMRKVFRWLFCAAIVFGFFKVESLWSVGDLLNGFTVLVNVIAVIFLIKYVVQETPKWSVD